LRPTDGPAEVGAIICRAVVPSSEPVLALGDPLPKAVRGHGIERLIQTGLPITGPNHPAGGALRTEAA
jgi:hypothetical protein